MSPRLGFSLVDACLMYIPDALAVTVFHQKCVVEITVFSHFSQVVFSIGYGVVVGDEHPVQSFVGDVFGIEFTQLFHRIIAGLVRIKLRQGYDLYLIIRPSSFRRGD